MKHIQLLFTLSFILFFSLYSTNSYSQYLETFSTPNKGATSGTNVSGSSTGACPANTLAACTNNDFTGESWTITGNFTGFDSNDKMATDGTGVLFVHGDIDNELCFESPVLDISSEPANLSALIAWFDHDGPDYADVEYQVDGGAWAQVPNQYGGGAHTVDFPSTNYGSGTVTHSGITGTTMSIRVCFDTNTDSDGEMHTLDNVSSSASILLPVKLISFIAEKRENGVILNWTTASENNNEKFEIEHSTNKKPFEKIGEIEGNITTLQISNYSFNHERPTTGINYYRLKQIDLDGKFEYSNVVSIQVKSDKESISDFYPNPSENGTVFLDYTSNTKSDLNIAIYDTAGKKVLHQNLIIEKGKNKLHFDFSAVEKGIYFVRLKNDDNQEYRKLIIN